MQKRENRGGAHIPSNYSRLMARELGLSAKGIPELLAGTALRVEEFLDESCLLTPDEQVRILENAIRLSSEPGFGLRVGQRLTPLSHGAMGFMAYSSPDLRTALDAIQVYIPTRLSFARILLEVKREWLICQVRFDYPIPDGVHRCLCETVAGMYCSVAELILGRPVAEADFSFPFAQPEYRAYYGELLPGKIRFDAGNFEISVPQAIARIPNASANHHNYLLAKQQCEAMLVAMHEQDPGIQTRLKQVLLSHPPGTVTEEGAASEFFMSKRTLARRLDEEGTSFRRIRDELLASQAAQYLCGDQLSVEAVATLLNYHDSANFRRAFKRWFGMSPGQFRQQNSRVS